MVHGVGGGGTLTIFPARIEFRPDTMTNVLAGSPEVVVHTERRVTVVHARLVPPWMNRHLILMQGTETVAVNIVGAGGKTTQALRSAGFQPELRVSWFSLSGGARRRPSADHERDPRAAGLTIPAQVKGLIMVAGVLLIGGGLLLGFSDARVAMPPVDREFVVAVWIGGLCLGAWQGWWVGGRMRDGLGVFPPRGLWRFAGIPLVLLFVVCLQTPSIARWLSVVITPFVLAGFGASALIAAKRIPSSAR
jgi:hypothetical protein